MPGYRTPPPVNQPIGYQATPNLQSQIQSLFGEIGVPVGLHASGQYEDPRSRLDRLAGEMSAGRSFEDIRSSIEDIAAGLDPNRRRAESIASYEFDPARNELDRTLQMLGLQQNRDVDAVNQFMGFGNTALQDTYSELSRILNQNSQGVQQAFQGAQDQTAGAYGQAAGLAQGAQEAALADTSGEAAALGVRGAVVDPHAELRNSVSDMLRFNAQGQSNAQSVLANMAGGYGAINSQAQNDVGMEQALAQNQLQVGGQDLLGQIMGQYGEQRFETLGSLDDLAMQRGGRVSELTQQFEDQSYERTRQERIDELAAEVQRGTMSLQQAELEFQRERFLHELDLSNRQLDLDAQLGRGGLGLQGRQLDLDAEIRRAQVDNDRRALEIQLQGVDPNSLEGQLLQAQINSLNAETEGIGQDFGIGQMGVNNFFEDFTGPQENALNTTWDTLRDIVSRQIADPLNNPNPGGAPIQDPLVLFDNILNNPSMSYARSAYGDLLRQLAEIYYG